jgi:hypothetical protein
MYTKDKDYHASFEPKTAYRFLVEFPEELNIKSWAVQKINKPKFVNNQWDVIRIEFIDTINESVIHGLYKLVEKIKCSNDSETLLTIYINSLDPTGNVIESIEVSTSKITIIDFGDLDYANDDIQKPIIEFFPDNCKFI